jgi:hypothetical protein
MDYLTLIGNSCFTAAEAKKLQAAIKGPAIQEIRGFWIHYVHLNHSDRASQQVRPFFLVMEALFQTFKIIWYILKHSRILNF